MHEDSPLLEAISLWEQITGVKVPDSEFGSFSMGSWRIRDTYKDLREALELDPTEITANMLFAHFVREYTQEASVSMADLLADPTSHMETLDKVRRLLAITNRPEIAQARDAFISGLKAGLAQIGALERKDVQDVLDNPAAMAILRRDALRSAANLRVDQFLRGEPSDAPPSYVPMVHAWWNVNSLLAAASKLPSGVALNLIRDPNAYESYFAFTLRNGANLFILTDVPEHAHPFAAEMTRKPGRDMDRRIAKNWFPYELLDYKVDEKGEIYFASHSEATGLIPYQKHHTPLKKINEVGPAEVVWITMMFDLLLRKFWKEGFQAPQLSYTAEMIIETNALLDVAQAHNLPLAPGQSLTMPRLTIDDVTENLDAAQVGKTYDGPNEWLIERYKHLVPETTLNVIATGGQELALVHATGEVAPLKKVDTFLMSGAQKRQVRQATTEVRQLVASKFGSPAQLDADRRFVGRFNLAVQVDKLADEEFDQRKDEVKRWYIGRVRKNLPEILRWALNEEIWVDDGITTANHHQKSGPSRYVDLDDEDPLTGGFRGRRRVFHGLLRHFDITSANKDSWNRINSYEGTGFGGFRVLGRSGGYRTCTVNQARASTTSIFYPTTTEELCAFAACRFEDLPDVLQTWSLKDDYHGNSILDRIDPALWKLQNPWIGLDLRINIPLSVSGRAKIMRERGPALPPIAHIVTPEEARGMCTTTIRMGGNYKG